MTFWKRDTISVRAHALKLLKRMGHKFAGDIDWISVRHNPNNNYHLQPGVEDAVIDALTIQCTSEDCQMKFDINASTSRHGTQVEKFLLWHGCAGIAEIEPARTDGAFADDFVVENQSAITRCVCKKFQVLT